MSLTKATELRQERASLWEQAKAIHTEYEGQPLPEDKRAEYDRHMARVDELKNQIDDIEGREADAKRLDDEMRELQDRLDAGRDFGEDGPSAEELTKRHNQAFVKWLRAGAANSESERRERKEEAERELRDIGRQVHEAEQRATGTQTKGTAAEGGDWVPTDFRSTAVEQLKAFGGMRRSRATVVTTENGRNLDHPTYDDTGNVGQIVGEGSTFTSTHVPVSKFTLEATKYGTGPIKLSREILADSAVDIMGVVRRSLVTRIGRITERHYATRSSTESVGPHGLVNASTGNVTIVKGSTNITPEKLMDLIHQVDPAYRGMGQWMFADQVLLAIRKLRTGTSNNFFWQPGLQVGEPDRLLGFEYIINQSLNDSVGSTAQNQSIDAGGTKPIWFGDFGAFYIRDVLNLELRLLTERYAPEDMVALLGFMRTDARPGFATTDASLKPIKAILTTTA